MLGPVQQPTATSQSSRSKLRMDLIHGGIQLYVLHFVWIREQAPLLPNAAGELAHTNSQQPNADRSSGGRLDSSSAIAAWAMSWVTPVACGSVTARVIVRKSGKRSLNWTLADQEPFEMMLQAGWGLL